MKTTTRTPRNSSAARAPKQAATQPPPVPASPELSSRQRAALCRVADAHGRVSLEYLNEIAAGVQSEAAELHLAARTLELNPAAWDLAGASDPAILTEAELAEQAAIQPHKPTLLAHTAAVTAKVPASNYAIGLIDSFTMLRCRANTAEAVALLQADKMKLSMKAVDEWADLQTGGFNDGCTAAAQAAGIGFAIVWRSLHEMYGPAIERLRTLDDAIALGGSRGDAERAIIQAAGLGGGRDLDWQLDGVVGRFTGLLELQSSAIDYRGEETWDLTEATTKELNLAYEDFRKAAWQFESAVIALEQAQAAERRAA